MRERRIRRFAGFPVIFLSTAPANLGKRAADRSPGRLHLGICNVIQAVITLKTKKTTGTKTGWWSAA
jgi:hypothetical protein